MPAPRRPMDALRFRYPLQAIWRQWLLIVSLIAFLGVFSTALTHFHKDEAQELDCAICHVVGHQALDSHTPDLMPQAGIVPWLILPLPLISIGRIDRSPHRRPPSRAPPLNPL